MYGNKVAKFINSIQGNGRGVCKNDSPDLPIPKSGLPSRVKYLVFLLKSNAYIKCDWKWLIEKITNMTKLWCYKWLSLGGRLTLVKSVLEAKLVYWHSLAFPPKGILDSIR